MDVELAQFQKDLLESVREMNERGDLPFAEARLSMPERFDSQVSLPTTRPHNVSQKLKKCDT